jgi:methionine biosynthesis protein MetW
LGRKKAEKPGINLSKSAFYETRYYSGPAHEPRFDKVLAIACKNHGKRLLDVGCGDGSFTVLLKDALRSVEAAGIEISGEAVNTALEKGIHAHQIDIDTNSFPFNDEYFDVIYCGEVIEHIFDTDRLLKEISRTLKPSGYCIITTPNLAGWANRLSLLLGFQPFATSVSPGHEGVGKLIMKGDEGQWGHIRVFTTRALKELLQVHGFKIDKLIGCPVTAKTAHFTKLSAIANAIDKTLSNVTPLASRIILTARKD